MRAVIIGAGIGGLAAAVALRRVGVETLVVERVAGIREVGAGLSIWSNAMNALRELGVEASVIGAASVFERTMSRTPAGRPIAVSEFGDISRDAGAPCVCIHRAVLRRVLLEELPPEAVRTGARCVAFEDSTAILEDGERIEANVLVGADGISSLIREGLHGAEPPRYAGYTCWRGTCRDEGVLPERSTLLWARGHNSACGPAEWGSFTGSLRKTRPRAPRRPKRTPLRCAAIGPRRFPRSSKALPKVQSSTTILSTGRRSAGGAATESRCWGTRRTPSHRISVREPARRWRMP